MFAAQKLIIRRSYSIRCTHRQALHYAGLSLKRLPSYLANPYRIRSCTTKTPFLPEIDNLYRGNQRFRDAITKSATPNLLKDLAEHGQTTIFNFELFRQVGEQTIFSAKPGTLFTAANVANQFQNDDLNLKAALAYAVETLKVNHVIVMGHYGCGGVAAAMLPPDAEDKGNPVQAWIAPIRKVYESSERPGIVSHRQKVLGSLQQSVGQLALPHLHDPGFRALVEENVKANVQRIARSDIIIKHYTSVGTNPDLTGVFVHGWVYDIETGEVLDLDVTVGPDGRQPPATPFPKRSD